MLWEVALRAWGKEFSVTATTLSECNTFLSRIVILFVQLCRTLSVVIFKKAVSESVCNYCRDSSLYVAVTSPSQ